MIQLQNPLHNLRVLIADSNPTDQKILADCLASYGITPEVAANGREVLSMLMHNFNSDHPYDLVFLDSTLPVVDSFSIAAIVRNNPNLTKIRLLLVTTHPEVDRLKVVKAGFVTWITKPFDTRQVANQIMFAVNTPSYKGQNGSQAESQKSSASITKSILVVEDDPVNRKLMIMQIKKMGYQVASAENGKLAVEETQRHQYDLLLMDCNMPLMDGFEATRLIRAAEGQNGHIMIIALTASARPEDRQTCIEAGMDDFLAKPVRAEEIRYMMQKWLNRSAAAGVESVSESIFSGKIGSTESAAATPESPINAATLHALNELELAEGTNSMVALIEIFMESVPVLMTNLESALSAKNASAVRQAAHQLSSSSAYMGAERLSVLAKKLELTAINTPEAVGDPAVAALLAQLKDEYTRRIVPVLQSEIK